MVLLVQYNDIPLAAPAVQAALEKKETELHASLEEKDAELEELREEVRAAWWDGVFGPSVHVSCCKC